MQEEPVDHHSAKSKRPAMTEDAPMQEPMRSGIKPAQRKAPTVDQKKVRRAMQRKGAEVFPEQAVLTCLACGCRCKNKPCGACGSIMVQAREYPGATEWPDFEPEETPEDYGHCTNCGAGYSPSISGSCPTCGEETLHPDASSSPDYSQQDPFAPRRASTTQMAPGAQTQTREVAEDDDFDPYLITRCGDHGIKAVKDRPSQEHYIELAQHCHNQAWQPHTYSPHLWEHQANGDECWSCCKDMYVARPGERTSGRTAKRYQADYLDEAAKRDCQACGHSASPVLGDTGPACSRCGSYSLVRPGGQSGRTLGSRHEATQQQMNVATADGRILINPGDQVRTPTGQTMTIKNVRRHETSSNHYYVDTDAGTTVVPFSTQFEIVPHNTQQQAFPGFGTPGGNFNQLPFDTQNRGETNAPSAGGSGTCPVCGATGSLGRSGDKYRCSRCGFQANYMGGEQQYSDSPQTIQNLRTSSRDPRSAIAKRASTVLDQMKETTL